MKYFRCAFGVNLLTGAVFFFCLFFFTVRTSHTVFKPKVFFHCCLVHLMNFTPDELKIAQLTHTSQSFSKCLC